MFFFSCTKKNEQKEIVMWAHEEATFNNGFNKVIERYAEERGVKITLLTFPYDAYVQKVKTALASNKTPDIMEVFGVWMLEYKNTDTVMPLSEKLATYINENYFTPTQGAYQSGNNIYGLPFEYNIEGSVMLTNPRLFSKANVKYPPNTWEEFILAAKALTIHDKDTITQIGFDFTSYDSVANIFLQLILQQDGTYIDTITNKVDFSGKEAIRAMNIMKDLVVKDKVVNLSLLGTPEEPQDLLFKGVSAMAQRGPWAIAYGEETYGLQYIKDFEFEIMPSLSKNIPPYFASESGWGLVIPTSSSQSEIASDFLLFFSKEENMAIFNTISKTIPANKRIIEDTEFLNNNSVVKKLKSFLQYGSYIGDINTDFLKEEFLNTFPEIVNEDITVEKGLARIEKRINDFQ